MRGKKASAGKNDACRGFGWRANSGENAGGSGWEPICADRESLRCYSVLQRAYICENPGGVYLRDGVQYDPDQDVTGAAENTGKN